MENNSEEKIVIVSGKECERSERRMEESGVVSDVKLSTLKEPFKGNGLEDFIAYYGLFSIKPVLQKVKVESLTQLLEVLSSQDDNRAMTIEEATSSEDFEHLLQAIRGSGIDDTIVEEEIPYTLRSGRRKKSGKRKKSADNEDERDIELREMRQEIFSVEIILVVQQQLLFYFNNSCISTGKRKLAFELCTITFDMQHLWTWLLC